MENNKGLYLVVVSLIFSIGLIIAAYLLSSAINNVGYQINNAGVNTSNSLSTLNDDPREDYELIVNNGWLYLYDRGNGQVWKKADESDASWERVQHFTNK